MEDYIVYKSIKNGTFGLAKDAELHGCTQSEELRSRKLRAERLRQWNREQNEITIRIRSDCKFTHPKYIIGSDPSKREMDNK